MSDAAYSPQRRTAVVFSGAGTAGAYQAGVLQALTEAGAKIDVLAAHGPGVMAALAGAIDAAAGLWDPAGPWLSPKLQHAYRWRRALRIGGWGLIAAGVILVSPILVLLVAAAFYAGGVLMSLVNLPNASVWCIDRYGHVISVLFQPPILPTILPGALVLAMLAILGVLAASAFSATWRERSRRRWRGAFWWRLVGSPLTGDEPGASLAEALWQLVRGASKAAPTAPAEVGRRLVDILKDNLGQPGFREILIGVHDLDSRRDLVAAVLAGEARERFAAKRAGPGPREAETIDLTGPGAAIIVDLLHASCRLPVAVEPHLTAFPADSYWRGERHRLTDRPELISRLVEELSAAGVEQVVLVTAAQPPAAPHAMRAQPADLGGRIGEFVRSVEGAAFDDAWSMATPRFHQVFVIRPDHNAVGPFDFGGVYDEASDRQVSIAELMKQGYDDAYRQFIEPVVAGETA